MADEPSSSEGSKTSGKGEPAKPKRSFASRLPSARQVGFVLFGFMAALGVAFWAAWCYAFHVCIDNGVYAVVVTLGAFGLAGMWLTLPVRSRGA